jgi:uncharacterized protein YuzE
MARQTTVAESDESKPGVILDYDEHGDLVSMKIPDASRRVNETRKMGFHVAKEIQSPFRRGFTQIRAD